MAHQAFFKPDGTFDFEKSFAAVKQWYLDNQQYQHPELDEALKANTDLMPLFVAVQAKGYPTLADAMLVLVAALPDYVPSGA